MTIERLWTDLTSAGLSSKAWPTGRPRVGFVHDLEAPPRKGLGRELIQWSKSEGLSPHWVADPGGAYLWLDTSRQGAHVGGGNPYGVGYEVTGYASWSRQTWLAQGIDGLRWQAYCMAVDSERWGFELEWGSLEELGRLVPKYYTHNDSRIVWKGTTHTDPADGYPYDVVMNMAKEWRYGTGPIDVKDWWDTVDAAQAEAMVRRVVKEEVGNKLGQLDQVIRETFNNSEWTNTNLDKFMSNDSKSPDSVGYKVWAQRIAEVENLPAWAVLARAAEDADPKA